MALHHLRKIPTSSMQQTRCGLALLLSVSPASSPAPSNLTFIYILEIPRKLLALGMRCILRCFSLPSCQPEMFFPVSFASAATQGSSPQGGLPRCLRPGSKPSPGLVKHPGYTSGLGMGKGTDLGLSLPGFQLD